MNLRFEAVTCGSASDGSATAVTVTIVVERESAAREEAGRDAPERADRLDLRVCLIDRRGRPTYGRGSTVAGAGRRRVEILLGPLGPGGYTCYLLVSGPAGRFEAEPREVTIS